MKIVETNPAVFMIELERAIKSGFYVQNTIPGAPSLTTLLEVTLFPEAPSLEELVADEVTIQGYESMNFLLDVQNAILNGMTIDVDSVNLYGLKSVKLVRKVKAEEVVSVQPATQDTVKQRGRKPKTKE